jgi:ubiquinone/menaquinone biosynthesis C-methylase UbiE
MQTPHRDDGPRPADHARANERVRRSYARWHRSYDVSTGLWERLVFGQHRTWCCSRALGSTLEVAIGTGLNLAHYPADVRLTAVDLTPEMLERARGRAAWLGRDVDLPQADALALPFPDETFDTVVCTYALCSIPDDAAAIAEMARVLVPSGRLILLDHVASSVKPLYWLQRLHERLVLAHTSGEHQTRRPARHLAGAGLRVVAGDRLRAGVIERVVALKPASHQASAG